MLRAEWTKLRTVRSTIWSLLATVVLTIAIGGLATAVIAARWNQLSLFERLTFDPVSQSLTGLLFAQLAHRACSAFWWSAPSTAPGTIRARPWPPCPTGRWCWRPRRWSSALVALVVSEAVSFAAFLLGQAMLSGAHPDGLAV